MIRRTKKVHMYIYMVRKWKCKNVYDLDEKVLKAHVYGLDVQLQSVYGHNDEELLKFRVWSGRARVKRILSHRESIKGSCLWSGRVKCLFPDEEVLMVHVIGPNVPV